MGRDYIGERTIADPRERAVERRRRRERTRERAAAARAALARYREKCRWCVVPGCGRPSATGEAGFWPCCSQACTQRWEVELQRREEVAQARRLGIPVAQLRAARLGVAAVADAAPPLHDEPSASTDEPSASPGLPRFCLIACSGTKAAAAAPALRLYQGDLFVKSLAWALRQRFADVAILSAKHGLVSLDQVVAPYNESLTSATRAARRRWADGVLAGLLERWPLVSTPCEITFLAGRRYTEPLIEVLLAAAPGTLVQRPLSGLGIGQQKAWLTSQLRELPENMPALVST